MKPEHREVRRESRPCAIGSPHRDATTSVVFADRIAKVAAQIDLNARRSPALPPMTDES
jgi:hypothetical protein